MTLGTLVLTCVVCDESVGTVMDKNVPTRCKECDRPCPECGGPAINANGDECRCLLDLYKD